MIDFKNMVFITEYFIFAQVFTGSILEDENQNNCRFFIIIIDLSLC
jgi:hypothetical protein